MADDKKAEKERKKQEKEQKKLDEAYKKEVKKREKLKKNLDSFDKYVAPAGQDDETTPGPKAVIVTETGKAKSKPLIIVDTIDQLPADVQDTIKKMKVDLAKIQEHFGVMLNILTFLDTSKPRRVFRTTAEQKRREESKVSALEEANIHPPHWMKGTNGIEQGLWTEVNIKEATKKYKIGSCLGEGGFGQVFEAKCGDKGVPKKIAVKIVEHKTEKDIRMNMEEVAFLQHCNDQPNICKLYKSIHVGQEVWMALELMKGGTLKQTASVSSQPFTAQQIGYVAKNVLQGLKYIHAKGVVHRDLKNLNIMLTDTGEVKIIDFGLAVDISRGPRKQMVGSPFWMPPEMIRGEPHSYPADIWSFMICVLELANNNPPNLSNEKRALFISAVVGFEKDWGLTDPGKWPNELKDFLTKCQSLDPTKRASAADLLAHPLCENAAPEKEMKKKLNDVFTAMNLSRANLIQL